MFVVEACCSHIQENRNIGFYRPSLSAEKVNMGRALVKKPLMIENCGGWNRRVLDDLPGLLACMIEIMLSRNEEAARSKSCSFVATKMARSHSQRNLVELSGSSISPSTAINCSDCMTFKKKDLGRFICWRGIDSIQRKSMTLLGEIYLRCRGLSRHIQMSYSIYETQGRNRNG